jgi:hypothetical protein
VNARTTRRFRACLAELPTDVRRRAREAFLLWRENPNHPGLEFKRLRTRGEVYSARIGMDWRALAVRDEDTFIWFWIGSHAEYDRLLTRL